MTNAEYIESEFRKALRDDHGPVETIRVKAEGPYGSSRWVSLPVAAFEAMTTAAANAMTEPEGRA
ncbi:hypothetical protein ACFW2V_13400 [Streptomyces sp. NPDC058947]|uniref:hypothetical protein n=1 Tax=Streptomyces sp. NPDC058947 TaxID=3346675 RepID=UPI00367B8279